MALPPIISTPPEDEVVDDSEPEREQRRQLRRAQRRTKRNLQNSIPSTLVVVVSSESDSPRRRPSRPPLHHDVIEISDSSDSSDIERVEAQLREEDAEDVIVEDTASISFDPQPLVVVSNAEAVLTPVDNSETIFPSVRDILGIPHGGAVMRSSSTSPNVVNSPVPGSPTFTTRMEVEDAPEPEHVNSPQRANSKPLNIAQYAYSRASSVATTVRSSTLSRVTVPPAESTTKPIRANRDSLGDLTAADMIRLRKCVSCSQNWTTRKTTAQKIKHIKTCARKKKLTEQTVCVLVRQELESAPPLEIVAKPPPWIKDSAAFMPPPPPQPTTLLEEVVNGDTAKKKGRRPKAVENVKELTETRQSILDRARVLLREPVPQNALRSAIAPQDEGSFSLPSTQPFGESALASKFQSKPASEQEPTQIYRPTPAITAGPSRVSPPPQEPCNDEFAEPPVTQPFGESSLAKKFASGARYLDMDEDLSFGQQSGRHVFDERSNSSPQRERFLPPRYAGPSVAPMLDSDVEFMDDPMFTHHSTPQRANTSPSPLKHYSANDLGPWLPSTTPSPPSPGFAFPRPSSPRSPPSMRALSGQEAWHNTYDLPDDNILSNWNNPLDEDAFLHYEPDERVSPVIESNTLPQSPAAVHPRADTAFTEDPPEPKKKSAKKPSSKTKKTKDQTDTLKSKDVTDEELYNKLQTSILEDSQLYSRILRYEPVHFDTFLQIALDMGIKSSGPLKLRVRAYLDKQAIHFYGHDPTTDRTRRRR